VDQAGALYESGRKVFMFQVVYAVEETCDFFLQNPGSLQVYAGFISSRQSHLILLVSQVLLACFCSQAQ